MPEPVSVLFVCLGNICRSTMAEGIFRNLTKEPQYKDKIGKIDSCGMGSCFWVLSCPGEDAQGLGLTGVALQGHTIRANRPTRGLWPRSRPTASQITTTRLERSAARSSSP